MNTLQVAYKILYSLEHDKKADYMGLVISPQKLNVSEDKWLDIIQMLMDEQYISGACISKDILGNTNVDISKIRITLKGAEYLHENSVMRKIGETATNIITIVKP